MKAWTAKYDALARSTKARDPLLFKKEHADPGALLAYQLDRVKDLNLRFLRKPSLRAKFFRMATTVGMFIVLPENWDSRSIASQAKTLAHEITHTWQDVMFPAYQLRYLFSTRFRIAMEIQAYSESVAALVVMDKPVDAYIKSIARNMLKTYRSKRVGLRPEDIEAYLLDAKEDAKRRFGA